MSTLTITNRFNLTEIQKRTLQLVGEGLTNKEIASKRGVSAQTVKNELSALYQRLGFQAHAGREEIIGALFRYAEYLGITVEYVIQNTWWGWPLTSAEEEIFSLVIRGMSNKEVACQLGLAVHTVKSQLSVALDKMNIRNRSRDGIISLLVEHLEKKGENWLDILCPEFIPIPVKELCMLTHPLSNAILWNEGSEFLRYQVEGILFLLDSLPRKRAYVGGRVEEETIQISDEHWDLIKATMSLIEKEATTQRHVLEKEDERELAAVAV